MAACLAIVLVGGVIALAILVLGSSGPGTGPNSIQPSGVNVTYTGPIGGYYAHDPQNTARAAAQIESVIYNDVKNDYNPPPYVACNESAPNQYGCSIYSSGHVNETVNVQVNVADGSLSATCQDAAGYAITCPGEAA